MIDFIKGSIDYMGENYVVIENNNIGYKVYTSSFSISELSKDNNDVIIYTEMIVREDDISLCGFSSRNELQIFQLLTTVNGVGTKVALGILSGINYLELSRIIISGDIIPLTKAPGVGKKTAQRIILELKDKIQKKVDLSEVNTEMVITNQFNIGNEHQEAQEALVSLGYTKNEAKDILSKIDTNLPVEQVIKQALKQLMK